MQPRECPAQGVGNCRSRICVRLLMALAIIGFFFGTAGVSAQKLKPTEYELKAAYLYNFARFVEWPAASESAKNASFAICVIGQDPFGTALDGVVARETIDGKPVITKRIAKPQDAAACRVLYISSSEDSQLKAILSALDKSGVLTVSDIPQFSQRGGMIEFVPEGSRIRFEVNLASAEDAGLILSSDLLKVATSVRRNLQPGD